MSELPNIDVAGEWELTPRELSSIFRQKGWAWDDGEGSLVSPSPEAIRALINALVHEMENQAGEYYAIQRGRFLVFPDPLTPGSHDVFLNVGYAWRGEHLTDEEREVLDGIRDIEEENE